MPIKKSEDWQPWQFENGRLRKSLPSDLVPEEIVSSDDEKFREYLLTLALIFNDIKGLLYLHDTVQDVFDVKASKGEISGNAGEQFGILEQVTKLLFATVREVLVFLDESSDVSDSERMQRLIAQTSGKTRLVWDVLARVARNEPVDDPRFSEYSELSDFLCRIRNNVGFHYQTRKQLISGFRKFFFNGIDGISEESRVWAYRSSESSAFDASRYYYADAALQGYIANLSGDEFNARKNTEKTLSLISLIVHTLNEILIKYHASLTPR